MGEMAGKALSLAEMKVMSVVWENGGIVTTGQLMLTLREYGKTWKRQTLNTLLSRMVEKEVIIRRPGKVVAAQTERGYYQFQCQQVLDKYFGGELSRFIAVYTGHDRLSTEDAQTLDRLLERMQEKGRKEQEAIEAKQKSLEEQDALEMQRRREARAAGAVPKAQRVRKSRKKQVTIET